jgi:hypothetical protein
MAVNFIFINYLSFWSRGILEEYFTGQKFPSVMEPAVSLPCLPNPVICPYPKLYESNPHNPILFLKDHCNSIFPSTLRSINRTHLSPNQNLVGVFLLPHTWHMSFPFFRHVVLNNKWLYFPLSRSSEVPKCTEGKRTVRASSLYGVKVSQRLN